MNTLNELKIDMFFSVQSIDTTTSAGKMIFNIFGSLAEFERELLRDRIKIGINRAREQGKTLGRKSIINESLIKAVKMLREKKCWNQRYFKRIKNWSWNNLQNSIKKMNEQY